MITEQELKDRCTSDTIKRMVELAEGFNVLESLDMVEYISGRSYFKAPMDEPYLEILNIYNVFPLLIHRAVEGRNKSNDEKSIAILKLAIVYSDFITNEYEIISKSYDYQDYQSQSLTQCECAMLHCLLDIFKGENK